MKNTLFLWVVILIIGCKTGPTSNQENTTKFQHWENEISKLEAKNEADLLKKDPILFIGSSSIVLWKTMEQDMAPWETINRGFGGSNYEEVLHFEDRLVEPFDPIAVGIFVANDISGSEKDVSPEVVAQRMKALVKEIQKDKGNLPIFVIAITPVGSRFSFWEKSKKANELMKLETQKMKNVHFIETESAFLKADGTPNDALFVEDRLHLNPEGYKIWVSIVRSELEKVLQKI